LRKSLSKGTTMLALRYLGLLLFLQIVSILHYWPWAYVWGIVQWPYWLIRVMMIDESSKRSCIAQGAAYTLGAAGTEAPPMPAFLRRRFEMIHQEALS
jgi:hypothetical protein